MNQTIILCLITLAAVLTVGYAGYASYISVNEAQATGGGEVIELVIPMIDDTVKSIQNNDTEKAISQLEEIKTELQDTFFAEEEN